MISKNFSFRDRPRLIEEARAKIFDILIVGGGVTGAAVARDAALRGLSVLLLEADDFASGTSSGSTKLLHGGLRYLEQYDFKLVFEAIRERELLDRLYAPFAQNLDFIFPTYSDRPPPRWKLNLGLILYDSFSFFHRRHRNLNRAKTLEKFPFLKEQNLTGACIYNDSFAEDFRLVTELIKSSVRDGAICLNQIQVKAFSTSPTASFTTVTASDRWNENSAPLEFRGKFVYNCSGPFSDEVRELMGLSPALQRTQGVHFLIPHRRLPISSAFVLAEPELHRILFAIPWDDAVYIGTTDTSISDPRLAQATSSDVDYVLSVMNQYFSTGLRPNDIFQSWAAVRPLIRPSKEESNSEVSREHKIEENPKNIFHILGGKLTSHRLMAEEALAHLNGRIPLRPSATHERPLQGEAWHAQSIDLIEQRIGRFKSDVLQLDHERGLHRKALSSIKNYLVSEVLYSIYYEMALRPIDFLRRRSSLYYLQPSAELAREVTEIFAQEQNWSAEKKELELQRVLKAYAWDQQAFKKPADSKKAAT